MPGSIWRRIGLHVLAMGSDYVCTLAGRLNDALLHNERLPAQPMPIAGKRPSAKVVGAKELPLRAKLVPHGRKETTNREKTKVATMGIE